jgi:hypothetical protein
MSNPCPDDKILNPVSKKCVERDGRVGRKILREMQERGENPKEPCPEDKILNPKTGKCVDRTGRLGKQIAHEIEEQQPQREPEIPADPNVKLCPEDKILNPKSGKCIDRTGRLGKQIAREMGIRPRPRTVPQEEKREEVPSVQPEYGCTYIEGARPCRVNQSSSMVDVRCERSGKERPSCRKKTEEKVYVAQPSLYVPVVQPEVAPSESPSIEKKEEEESEVVSEVESEEIEESEVEESEVEESEVESEEIEEPVSSKALLESTLQEFYHNYDETKTSLLNTCKSEEERKRLEQISDTILSTIYDMEKQHRTSYTTNAFDHVGSTTFQYYPDLTDTRFHDTIFRKKEFHEYTAQYRDINRKSELETLMYKPTPSQTLAKHYLSQYTPYNGILLWHGVGVGKTCSSVRIAENFRDYVIAHKKRILILTPSDTLIRTWQNEIFNVDKEHRKIRMNLQSNVQCTGTRYTDELNIDPSIWSDNSQIPRIQSKVRRVINKYYELMGYRTLVNSIRDGMKMQKIDDPEVDEYRRIQYIRKRFSNMVIIMDEAHFLRDIGAETDKDVKMATPYIEMIMRYAENTKVVLSTATPMYNSPQEMVGLLNFLLWNDKRPPISSSELFTSDGAFRDDASREKFIEYARGYISYVRGENPFDFPLKLEPQTNMYVPNPSKQYVAGELAPLKKSQRIKDLTFYRDEMSDFQYEVLKSIMENKASYENENVGFGIRPMQASIMVFPTGDVGDRGFQTCIQYDATKGVYSYAESKYEGFLKRENVNRYSSKIKNILDAVMSSKGIVFIYSKYINSGILPLALALEESGFMNYGSDGKKTHWFNSKTTRDDGNNFCAVNNKHKKDMTTGELARFSQASYIYLSSTTPNIDELLRRCNSEENRYGKNIKVIIGSAVTGQGLNFKNIRQVHIVEPWYHFNALEQSIGRAIRRESHSALPDEERNVTVFIHVSTLPSSHPDYEKRIETYDERAYRIAYHKKVHMAEVERLLKVNAVDCELLRKGNQYTEKQYPIIRNIVDSFGYTRRVPIYDKENSMICDLQSCEYKCAVDSPSADSVAVKENTDTYIPYHENDKVAIYKEIIKQVFINDSNYTTDGLLKETMKKAEELGIHASADEPVILQSVTEMVENRDIVYNSEFQSGVIVAYQDTYVFTPLSLMERPSGLRATKPEFRNVSLPTLYRGFPNPMLRMDVKHDPDKKIIELYMERRIEEEKKVERELDKVMEESYEIARDSIESQYRSYPLNESDDRRKSNNLIPTQDQLIKYKFMSLFEMNLDDNERLHVILDIAEKSYLKKVLTPIETIIRDYYDTPSRQTYIIHKPVPYSAVVYADHEGTMHLYTASREGKFKEIQFTDMYKPYQWSAFPVKGQKIYGWISEKVRGDKKKVFYLYNVTDKDTGKSADEKDGMKKTSRKTLIRGSICGTSSKPEKVIQLINNLTKQNINYDTQRKNLRNKIEICDELELILRHLDATIGSKTVRYFYRTEEIYP